MDLSTPEGRLAAIESMGIERYNRAMAEQAARNTVEVVNGYPLRWVDSMWGRLVMVDGADVAFYTVGEARAHALKQKAKS